MKDHLETAAAVFGMGVVMHAVLKTVVPFSGWFWTVLVQFNS